MDAVVAALHLKGGAESTWAKGIEAAYADKVFVTPSLGDWILAVGWGLLFKGNSPKSIQPMLAKLSKQFGEAQYFCTYRIPEAHCWAVARSGKMVRAFGYTGERGEMTWNEGKPTKAELAWGKDALDFPGPDESQVMEVAAAWSVNPCELESNFTEPGLGRLCVVA